MKTVREKVSVFAIALFSLFAINAQAQYSEYEVKAAYIFNFAKFIDWPANYIADTICLCVYKNDPFGTILEKTMIGRKVDGKDWKIKRINDVSEIGECHILVFHEIKHHEILAVFDKIKNKPIVTIGDEIVNFCEMGGVINFLPQFSERQFEINKNIADYINIRISPKLLLLAKIISTKEDEF